MWGFAPLLAKFGRGALDEVFVNGITIVCVAIFVITVAMSGIRTTGGVMGFLSPSRTILFLFGASGAGPVFGLGHWWSILSASWLHGNLMHIFFNMYAIRVIGPHHRVLWPEPDVHHLHSFRRDRVSHHDSRRLLVSVCSVALARCG
jgi:rhomboid protease GluP